MLKRFKKKLTIIFVLIASAVCIISVLYKINTGKEIMADSRHYNSFILIKELSLPIVSKYMALAGKYQSQFFFQTDDPSKLLIVDHNFSGTSFFKTGFSIADTKGQAFIYKIHSHFLYLFVGNLSQVKRVNLIDRSIRTFKTPSVFTKVLLIDTAQFSLLGFAQKAPHGMVLQNGLIGNNQTVSFVEQALPSTLPSRNYLFVMDGFLHFNRIDSNIILTPFYQTRTHILKYRSSIKNVLPSIVQDTVSEPIKGAFNQGRYTNASPKRSFQLYSGLIGDTLFVQSKVPAKEDTYTFFKSHLILDSYCLQNRHYLGSYAIPKKKNLKAKVVPYAEGIFIIYPSNIQLIKP
ncbi:MAG TPA: hypothetical protein VN040_14705 [Pseudosphingobacterium sp.]|nr:hypothetical protein [Pseudosphingobacterium sp.]